MDWLLPLVVGLIIGVVITWVISETRSRRALDAIRTQSGEVLKNAQAGLTAELERRAQEVRQKEAQFVDLRQEFESEKTGRADSEAELRHARESLAALKKSLDEVRTLMTNEFTTISKTILKEALTEARGDIDARRTAIENLLSPLKESLGKYETALTAVESARQEAYGSLKSQLEQVSTTATSLKKETASLVTALRRPQVRGQWGEVQLRNAAEIAGMSEFCDFEEQVSFPEGGRKWRPDMIVRLPGNREIIVDSKVPLDAYLNYAEAESDGARDEALRQHAKQLRDHVKSLSDQDYWRKRVNSADFVVMFIPNEAIYVAAVTADPTLYEASLRQNVVIATPATFVALLRTAAMNWREARLAKSASEIHELGRELYDRVATFVENLHRMGSKLTDATKSYNDAVASFEGRLSSQIRKFRDLGVSPKKEIPVLEPVEIMPRLPVIEATGAGEEEA